MNYLKVSPKVLKAKPKYGKAAICGILDPKRE